MLLQRTAELVQHLPVIALVWLLASCNILYVS